MTQPTNYQEEVKRVADRIDDALIAAVHRMDENDDINLDNIIVALGEARAYIVGLSIRLIAVDRLLISIPGDAPRLYVTEIPEGAKPKPLPLPKLQKQKQGDTRLWEKQRPGIAKKLKSPRGFDCPTCHAEAGTSCFRFTKQGINGKVTDQRNSGTTYHSARQALSVAHNDRMRREYDRAHFEAQS